MYDVPFVHACMHCIIVSACARDVAGYQYIPGLWSAAWPAPFSCGTDAIQ